MPNNTRTQADGTWVDGYTVPRTDWEDLERKVFEAWNGFSGGAYCAPVGGGGSAYTFTGSGLVVTGPTKLTRGGVVLGGAAAFVIRNGVWPLLGTTHRARSRKIVQPIDSFTTQKHYLWSRIHPYAGVGSVALACREPSTHRIETSDLYIPLRVIDGSTMAQVELIFRVASKRVYAPIAMPKLRIVRVPKDVGALAADGKSIKMPEPLKLTSDGLGFDFTPLVTSADAWYAGGAAQSFTYVCDQNHAIDVANYHYVAHLVEEVGAVSSEDAFDGIRYTERKMRVNLVGSLISPTGNVAADGSTTSNERVLLVDSDVQRATGLEEPNGYAALNGIWDATAAVWNRAADCDGQVDFTNSWIVTVRYGSINSETTWQCVAPGPSSNLDLSVPTAGPTVAAPSLLKTQILMQPAEPKGNIYHSLVPTFNVTDLRFQ